MANVCVFCGRAVKSPEVRYTQGEKAMCIARFNLAVERRGKDNGADYPNMIAFGKTAEFVEKHINKGTKVVVRSHYQSGSYTNKDGQKVYTHDFVVDDIEFAESKAAASQNQQTAPTGNNINDYVNAIPGIDESLPFA